MNKETCSSRSRSLLFLLLLVSLVVVPAIGCASSQKPEARPSQKLPTAARQAPSPTRKAGPAATDFVLEDVNGREVRLASFRGKNLLLVFWSVYCDWCDKEKPDLSRLAEEKKGKVEVVAIVGESRQEILDYIKGEEVAFQILIDRGWKVFAYHGAVGTPDHFLLDARGETVGRRPGYANYEALSKLTSILP